MLICFLMAEGGCVIDLASVASVDANLIVLSFVQHVL